MVDIVECVFMESQTISMIHLDYLNTALWKKNFHPLLWGVMVFRKPTYTVLILNSSAMCPQKWKFGLIQCLLHRAYTISGSWLTFSWEVDFLKCVFSQNWYPEDLFTSCLRQFVNNKCVKRTQKFKIKEDRVENIFFIPYMYIGLPSIIFSQKLKELFKKYYCIDISVCFHIFQSENLLFTEVPYSLALAGKCSL